MAGSPVLFFLTAWDLKTPRSVYVMTSCHLKTDSPHARHFSEEDRDVRGSGKIIG